MRLGKRNTHPKTLMTGSDIKSEQVKSLHAFYQNTYYALMMPLTVNRKQMCKTQNRLIDGLTL